MWMYQCTDIDFSAHTRYSACVQSQTCLSLSPLAPVAKKPPGTSVTLGGRTYTPDDLQALSEGTHPLMDSLPEIDESVDPFDVPALKKMHPWLKVSVLYVYLVCCM